MLPEELWKWLFQQDNQAIVVLVMSNLACLWMLRSARHDARCERNRYERLETSYREALMRTTSNLDQVGAALERLRDAVLQQRPSSVVSTMPPVA